MISLSYAQESKTFHLKNGSIIKGKVIEEQPGVSYKVKTSDGNIFVFEANEISKITIEEKSNPKTGLSHGVKFNNMNEMDISGLIMDNENTYSIGISSVNGISIHERLAVGIGAEYKYTIYGTIFPVYLDIRLNILNNVHTPFINLAMGGAMNTMRIPFKVVKPNGHVYEHPIPYENGAFGRVALGYKTHVVNAVDISFSVAYSMQTYSTNVWLYDQYYFQTNGIMHYVGLRLGAGLKIPAKPKVAN